MIDEDGTAPELFEPDRPQHLNQLTDQFLLTGQALALVVALLGAAVLLGYALRSPTVVEITLHLPPMYPNAALGFLAGGLGVLLAGRGRVWRDRLATVLGAVMVGIGGLSLGLHINDAGRTWFEGLWPWNDPFVAATTPVAGRPVPETCLAFILLGVAIVLLGLQRAPRCTQALALAATTVGLAAVIGYAIGVDRSRLGGSLVTVGMALHTALGITALGLAVLMIRPSVGILGQLTDAGPGGRIGRRLVLVVIGAPLLLAASTALLARTVPDAQLADSLLAVLQVASLGALVLIPAAGIERFERIATEATKSARRQAEAAAERDPLIDAIATDLLAPPPEVPGWDIGVRQEPAYGELAGDSVQVLRRFDGRTLVAVVDVAGHGALPGLLAYRLRVEIAALWDARVELAELMATLNRRVIQQRSLASAVLLSFDEGTGRADYVNAGHPGAIHVHGGRLTTWESTGRILAVPGSGYTPQTKALAPGDVLVLYTDGVSEARNADASLLGREPIVALVRSRRHENADDIAASLVDLALDHGGFRLRDDALVVVLTHRTDVLG